MVMILPSILVLGPFFLLVIAFLTPKKNWWVLYTSAFVFASIFLLVAFWAGQETALTVQISRSGPRQSDSSQPAYPHGGMQREGDGRAFVGGANR